MKILLDENFPVKLNSDFVGFEVYTVSELKWNGLKNGKLLRLMEDNNFDFLITLDKKLKFQQNLEKFNISVILFDVKDARIEKLRLIVDKAISILNSGNKNKFFSIMD
jgi:hypothetical protein